MMNLIFKVMVDGEPMTVERVPYGSCSCCVFTENEGHGFSFCVACSVLHK